MVPFLRRGGVALPMLTYILLSSALPHSFDKYQRQSFLSLGSDDTADMEPQCTYMAIHHSSRSLDHQHRLNFLWGKQNGEKINKYSTREVNSCRVDSFLSICNLRSFSQKVNIPQSSDCKERAD